MIALAINIVLIATITGCATPQQKAQQLAVGHGLQPLVLQGTTFRHHSFAVIPAPSDSLVVFIDGDGSPWRAGGRKIAADPTPRTPLALKMAAVTPGAVLYLGRPCYLEPSEPPRCSQNLWTAERYSQAVVESMTAAATSFITEHHFRHVLLVGYSGGATIAALMARDLPGVTGLVSVAGNLDPDAWAQLHGYLPLKGSLNPSLQPALPTTLRQWYLVGQRDTNVPAAATAHYIDRVPPDRVWSYPRFDHACCWVSEWPSIYTRISAELAPARPRVRVDSGELIGTEANGVFAFKGIPYAAPPIGELRWRAPQLPEPWHTARSSEDYGHSCPQRSPPERVAPTSQGATTSEDCLTLNVWTPMRSQQLLPVMVWIHGGGNSAGTSAQTYYDGTSFARDGVVLVSFNYRLGALGFFTHPALQGANFGLLDQLAALAWVKRNIGAFGGDPNNITVFGESAGGTDILMLMTARPAAGAFQKAIVESGGWWNYIRDLPEAQKAGAATATQWGLPGAAASAAQLRALAADALNNTADPGGFVIDHDLLTESPQAVIEHGRALDIPLIIGTNSNEGSLVSPDTPAAEVVGELSGPDFEQLKSLYGAPAALAPLLFRDAHFSMPARWIAAREAKGAPVYLYRFDYVASFLRHRRSGASHGSEIPFVFATWPDFRLDAADQHMTQTLHGCWVAFARTGRPACPQAPPWPAFSVDSDSWMRFAEPVAPEPVENRPVLNFLQQRLQK